MATSTLDEPKLPGGYLVTPRVPQGLAAAVEGLTREVLRHSPEDIYVFAAHHFEKLLHLREQCGGTERVAERDDNVRALREMTKALKMREIDRGKAKTMRNAMQDQVGWSLNQTARVLKRHRSIFGDAGRRISTDEVFRMAKQKEKNESSGKSRDERAERRPNRSTADESAENVWKASSGKTENFEDFGDANAASTEPRSGPRIITQIPSLQSGAGMLAKDIKTELRKNRISSRERRSVRAKPETRGPVERSGKSHSSERRTKVAETAMDKRRSTNESLDSTRSSRNGRNRSNDSQNGERKTEERAPGMERVKDYVIRRFATTKSLEELQSVNYVEKVQEIIDETGPIIKGKIDELKSGAIGRSKRSSWFTNPSSAINASNEGSNECRINADNRRSDENNSELRYRLTETQCLLENVSSSLTRSRRRSRSARSSRRSKSSVTTHEDLSNSTTTDPSNRASNREAESSKTRAPFDEFCSTLASRPIRRACSAKTLRKHDDGTSDDSVDVSRFDETGKFLEGLSSPLVAPPHRLGSAKASRVNANNDESSHSDSQSVSNVSLPAVRSISVKSSSGSVSRSVTDNLVLPAISPEAPKSAKVKEDLVLPILSPPGTASTIDDSKISGSKTSDLAHEEVDIPEIPVEDYTSETPLDDVFRDSLNVTPNFDGVPQRPDSLEPEEIHDLDERIQENLEISDDPVKFGVSDIKNKLQQLEEAERRIDRILDPEARNDGEDSSNFEGNIAGPIEVGEESNDNEESGSHRLSAISPEFLDSTYVLSEGSPYDIPDTVTTVIIPDRPVVSPPSSPIDLQSKDDEPQEATLLPETAKSSKSSSEEVADTKEPEISSPIYHEEQEEISKTVDESSRSLDESNQKPSSTMPSELFGELIEPEITESTSSVMNYICGVDNRSDIQISHQDLGRINEEMFEELEDLVERESASMETKKIDAALEISEAKEADVERKNDEDAKETIGVEESKDKTESDLSPMASRPEIDSESSNEAKESSAADEPLEQSAKRAMSLEDDEPSSETRTPESSNEVKETTLTDGPSLSLDPTRPYVPELNLDSLQDMTVSSFKMTEDEYENHCKVESENTNSITDTLTSDDNHRANDVAEFVEEHASSSERSKFFESNPPEEVVEETIVKSQVEVKEDICRKVEAYVMGTSTEDDEGARDETITIRRESQESHVENDETSTLDPPEETQSHASHISEVPEDSFGKQVANDEPTLTGTERQELLSAREKRDDEDLQTSSKLENVETVQDKNSEDDDARDYKEKEEVQKEANEEEQKEAAEEKQKEVAEAERKKADKEEQKEVAEEVQKEANEEEQREAAEEEQKEVAEEERKEADKEEQKEVAEEVQKEANEEQREDNEKEIGETEDSRSRIEAEASKINAMENEGSPVDNEEREEEKRDSVDTSSELKSGNDPITGSPKTEENEEEPVKCKGSPETSVDNSAVQMANEDGRSEADGNDESFVEEDTPLAVSRSASQCTTRRVSSGNLARLREEASVGWTEQVGSEIEDEKDQISKVKFSKIAGETISEQGSENDAILAKDSKEYHIYVPDVEAGEDYSTTDSSSTVESAVTKIQARVRGFLTRRRLHRGQQNRSSTLGSIASIQDCVAVEQNDKEEDETGLATAATKIQANYRRYKARNRLRREDAVHRTTLSLERSFADSGLRHTGEFHDCIPLPIHDLPLKKGSSILNTSSGSEKSSGSETISMSAHKDEIPSLNNSQTVESDSKDSMTNQGEMFFGPSASVPIIQFGASRMIGPSVDLVVIAKGEDALQSGYLNFITSVEDAEPVEPSAPSPIDSSKFAEGQHDSDESTKEPLALSDTPLGVVIEEVTSSGAEYFMKSDEPNVATESLASISSPRSDGHQVEEEKEDRLVENSASPEENLIASAGEKNEENNVYSPKSTKDRSMGSENFSFTDEKGLLGPESSVDSMECPVRKNNENILRSSDELVSDKAPKSGRKDEKLEESHSEPTESSSALSFSMKVQDFLGLGTEEPTKPGGEKAILEVTLKPSDLVKSKSDSQEGQLAGERIESPITMVQMTPGRSESLQRDPTVDGPDDLENDGKDPRISVESDDKQSAA